MEHGLFEELEYKKGIFKGFEKKIIASYDENPLFVAPYSASINKSLKKELKNIYISEKQSDAFSYNHRIAFDPHKANKEWCISIPKKRWDRMSENDFFNVVIETDVFNDEMIIGEITVKGKSNKTIALLADFCHPGQVNDSFSGLVMFMNLIKFLKEQKMKLKYTYSLIILPETIGSAVYLASKSQKKKSLVLFFLMIFVKEIVGILKKLEWQIRIWICLLNNVQKNFQI